ncbi:MAG: N-acetylgalactosamine 6-sulfate sulfatase [Opitutaceae bacterium]|nr:N-acetylgalactosamine 6-sulfate sulfatase [Opitutaceae bacterium]
MRFALPLIFLSLMLASCSRETDTSSSQPAQDKPNILFILVDDLGKEWVSAYGAEDIETPNVDRLAATGMKFENAYVMPQCTPTRLSFMTGQYPYRHGWVNHWDVPRWGGGAQYDWNRNPSLARVIKDAGYATAVAGKWQVSDFRIQPEAMVDIGFDEYCMWTGGEGGNPKSDERFWNPYIHTKEGSRIHEDVYGPDVFTDFLLDFIERSKDGPFFAYFPMVLTHTPFVTTPDNLNASTNMEKHKAMVRYTDKILGKFMDKLDELEIRENTIIVWVSDNGTVTSISGTQNGRLVKGEKGNTAEPGLCVPFIVNAPGLVPEGVVTDALTDVTDMLPTFAELVGGELQEGYVYDGVSIADHILGKTEDTDRSWILGMGGQNDAKLTEDGVENRFVFRDRVLRDKRFKLFVSPQRKAVKLVDVKADPAEETNLIDSSDPEAQAALLRLSALIPTFPKRDNDPIYTPLPAQPWDVPITAKSEVWKE